ncbi:MAG TPA: SH3 domain-containing protein [Thermomicrobiales bacterium]|nr:SH3 domain-containing protein [Thermomicrobiales bacterium]
MRLVRTPARSRALGSRVAAAVATFSLCTTGAAAAPAVPANLGQPVLAVSSADACADSEEVAFLALINDYRAASGLRPLSISASLSSAAAYHSVDMAANGYLAHTLLDGTTVEQNMANFGYEGSTHGENIAAGTQTAAEAMQTWQGSAEHNANMLNASFGAIGIGRASDPNSQYGWYWTTIFGDVSDGPGWLCGEAPPPSKSLSLFQSVDGATSASDVNLRTGPGAEYDVVTTLAPDTAMTVTGQEVNAFIPVKVDGMFGWVATDWVERGAITLEQTASPTQAGTATALQAVELQDAPTDGAAAMGTIPSVALVTLTGEAQDGFLRVVYEGQEGWADAAYLEVADNTSGAVVEQAQAAEAPTQTDNTAAAPAPNPNSPVGAEAVATNNVNLRAQPSSTAPILSVVPAGSAVTLTGSQANGYLNVRIAGQAGWIDSRYLQR